MRKQLHEWRVLVDCIIEKIWEYIDEIDYFDKDAHLWVDGKACSVILGDGDRKYPGEGRPVFLFLTTDDAGNMQPDEDYIEDYAAQWFNFPEPA